MSIGEILYYVFYGYSIALMIYIVMSWLPQVRQSPLGVFMARICEPYLAVFRRLIPPIGMIDISPIVALFVLQFVHRGLYVVISFIFSLIS
ncbi:YggT family protein [Croceifilum oryzae]|uniref:YggT family protein n=1 Tax=Croceifilum oryzae TaxID=1553429 RepID=A0AAJ1WRK0_9BACL|nr:YggT family protein [Croceifilum oryzae]MDQ0416408.1 YggT family protein [Croceifilum oryzae]